MTRLDYYAPRALEHWASVLAAHDPAASQLATTIINARQQDRVDDDESSASSLNGPIAHVRVFGFISARPSLSSLFFGGTSLAGLREQLARAVDAPRVRSILLEIDSPGGSVYGVHETWHAIKQADQRKPVTAAIAGLGASAAYWLASAARRIVVTPSGDVGSIGVYGIHEDSTQFWAAKGIVHTIVSAGKNKIEGLDLVPMNDETRARMQRLVDQKYSQFVGDVAVGRHATSDAVRSGYGEGSVMCASDALDARLVDAIEPVDVAHDRMSRLAADADRRAELAALADLKWE
jgi:signal peptide peptidase SppA